MTRAVSLIAVTMLCAGCSGSLTDSFPILQSKEKPVEPNIFPANFKQQILNVVPTVVADQTGIREAYYSDPVIDPKGTVTVYTSCVRFNARDASRQYAGAKEYIQYYYGGNLSQFVAAAPDQCRFATYKPFPELEKLCPSGKCT